jgi:hypothetical protein
MEKSLIEIKTNNSGICSKILKYLCQMFNSYRTFCCCCKTGSDLKYDVKKEKRIERRKSDKKELESSPNEKENGGIFAIDKVNKLFE